jgi:putative glycosyltransferase (TIGR04372 family)
MDREFVKHLGRLLSRVDEIEKIKMKSNEAYWRSEHNNYLNLRKSIWTEDSEIKLVPNKATYIVGTEITSSLGHLGHFADRCKAQILGLDLRKYVIVGNDFANPWFVKQYLGLYVPVITTTKATRNMIEIEAYDKLDQICLGFVGDRAMQFAKAHNEIELEWKKQFDEQPLFSLSDEDETHLKEYLSSKGLNEESWFVTLHLRDANYEEFRNSGNFNSYIEAVDRIISEGGWVIRVGSQETPPFPYKHARFIDYSNGGERTDRLDICLLAKCKFHFGTSSGVSEIPPLFGRGVLRINASRMGSNWIKWKSIEVPKILINRDSSTSKEIFSQHLSYGWLDVDHAPITRPELCLREATSDEILAGVEEILSSDYVQTTSEQKNIELSLSEHGIYPSTTVSRYFADKHRMYFS